MPNGQVLVGLDNPDDAGVYQLTDDLALVQTVDFFTPIVDDPYWFGKIAVANSLSDVYAMGGRPVTALNLVAFPVDKLPKEMLAEILRGGAEKIQEAGVALIGGHSIDDPEPKYGLAVTGLVHPQAITTKGGARPGDKLVLTKPIGIGTITTAIKRGLTTPEQEAEVATIMATLNDLVELFAPFNLKGVTDITGFGLLGHASEMARESGVGIRIFAPEVPVVPAAWEFGRQGVWPGGSKSNRRWLADKVHYDPGLDDVTQQMLCDAVTSGGLLIAVPAAAADDLVAALKERRTPAAAVVGECVAEHPGEIRVLG